MGSRWLRILRDALRSEKGAESLQILLLITIAAVCLVLAKLGWSQCSAFVRHALESLSGGW